MVDCDILGCCWIELPSNKWFRRSEKSGLKLTSRCQIEVDISWTDFVVHAPEGDWASVAKFTIHSFDIECAGRKGSIILFEQKLQKYFFTTIKILRYFFSHINIDIFIILYKI